MWKILLLLLSITQGTTVVRQLYASNSERVEILKKTTEMNPRCFDVEFEGILHAIDPDKYPKSSEVCSIPSSIGITFLSENRVKVLLEAIYKLDLTRKVQPSSNEVISLPELVQTQLAKRANEIDDVLSNRTRDSIALLAYVKRVQDQAVNRNKICTEHPLALAQAMSDAWPLLGPDMAQFREKRNYLPAFAGLVRVMKTCLLKNSYDAESANMNWDEYNTKYKSDPLVSDRLRFNTLDVHEVVSKLHREERAVNSLVSLWTAFHKLGPSVFSTAADIVYVSALEDLLKQVIEHQDKINKDLETTKSMVESTVAALRVIVKDEM